MSWYTCTPVSFSGGPDFFARDSGLICKGFQSIGIPCKSIMPLPNHPADIKDDLLRTEFNNLENPKWWQSIGAKNVVLYSWGHPKCKNVAKAIRDSGAKIFINLDNAGILSPRVIPRIYFTSVLSREIRKHGLLLGFLSGFLYNILYNCYIPLYCEPGRIAHLKEATAIGCISPAALSFWKLWARKYASET